MMCGSGLPDFSCFNKRTINGGKYVYQIIQKYLKWPESILNYSKMNQTAIKYSNIFSITRP
jgi:hypothetical protein